MIYMFILKHLVNPVKTTTEQQPAERNHRIASRHFAAYAHSRSHAHNNPSHQVHWQAATPLHASPRATPPDRPRESTNHSVLSPQTRAPHPCDQLQSPASPTLILQAQPT